MSEARATPSTLVLTFSIAKTVFANFRPAAVVEAVAVAVAVEAVARAVEAVAGLRVAATIACPVAASKTEC